MSYKKAKEKSEMPKDNNGGEPQTETFTKEQVQQMISDAVTKANEETERLKVNYGDRLTSFTFGSTVRFVKFSITNVKNK